MFHPLAVCMALLRASEENLWCLVKSNLKHSHMQDKSSMVSDCLVPGWVYPGWVYHVCHTLLVHPSTVSPMPGSNFTWFNDLNFVKQAAQKIENADSMLFKHCKHLHNKAASTSEVNQGSYNFTIQQLTNHNLLFVWFVCTTYATISCHLQSGDNIRSESSIQ